MYSGNNNDYGILNSPNARNFDFNSQSYFRASLEYRIKDAAPLYRASAYMAMFNFGLPKMIYGGSSIIERYILKNALRMQVGLEYATNKQAYANKFDYEIPQTTSIIVHEPEIFLADNRPSVEFIDNLTPQLKKKIKTTFKLTIGFDMPEDILITILNENLLEVEHSKHSRRWSNSIQGFAINRKHMRDFSSVFIKHNPLDMLFLTIGHEIGHCLSIAKSDVILEEAKAFAFELAWMKTIHKHDILGLANSMRMSLLNPAENGIHNVALDLVRKQLFDKEPIEVFMEIVKNNG